MEIDLTPEEMLFLKDILPFVSTHLEVLVMEGKTIEENRIRNKYMNDSRKKLIFIQSKILTAIDLYYEPQTPEEFEKELKEVIRQGAEVYKKKGYV